APHVSIHQADDVVEPLLAGNWRGLFAHKNIAGAMMVIFVFFGLFVARARSAVLGWSIVAAAAVFLVFCEAKAALGLLPVVLVLSTICRRSWSWILSGALLLAVLLALNLFTIGSLFVAPVRAINEQLLSDPTFTGRTDIWQFAIDKILERPWLGHGFGAFWET